MGTSSEPATTSRKAGICSFVGDAGEVPQNDTETATVSKEVGASEGEGDGTTEGNRLGSTVGSGVGHLVGSAVGWPVGNCVG